MVKAKHDVAVLEKCPTGIRGLDEILARPLAATKKVIFSLL